MSQQNIYFLKAEDFIKQGEKKLKGGFMSTVFGSKSQRAEEALELFKNAATNFKLAKAWEQAAEAYQRCASCEKMAKSGDEVEHLLEAANMMRKVNNAEAIQFYEQVVELYNNDSKIAQAAKQKKTIAEIYEGDMEYTLSAKNYQEAADLFNAESNYTSDYHKCLLKVAELKTLNPEQTSDDIIEAIQIYEQVAKKYLETNLLRPSAKNLFFQASLLHLANDDTVGCNKSLEQYVDLEPSFNMTREYKFLVELVKAIDEKSVQKFSDACYEFNKIIPLDKWKTNVLHKVKQFLEKSVKFNGGEFI